MQIIGNPIRHALRISRKAFHGLTFHQQLLRMDRQSKRDCCGKIVVSSATAPFGA